MRYLFLFLCALFLLLPAGLKRWTCSFHLSRFTPPALEEGCGVIYSKGPPEEVKQIFTQKFDYLGRGAQSFAFLSRDGNYVLKLFFFDRGSTLTKAKWLLESFKAAAYASEKTALVYLHFGPSKEPLMPLKLCGPAWHRKEIKSQNYCFALQRRAVLFKEALSSAYRSHQKDVFFKRIDSFFDLLQRRVSMGIRNSDRSLFGNFGFVEGDEAIEIDFGHYYLDPEWTQEAKRREIARYKKRLIEWVAHEMPEWLEEIEAR